MLIKRLRLKNFMIFTDVDVDFTKINIASVIGQWDSDIRRSNGAGKSALLESIPYALFGIARSKSKQDIIKRGYDKCEVTLNFEINGNDVEIIRQRSKTITQCSIEINGVKQSEQVRDSDDVIQSLLGIDAKLFDLIYFFRQNDQFGFLDSTPSERKSYLSKIFDMSVWDKCQETARKKYDFILKQITSVDGMIKGAESVLGQFKSIDELSNIIENQFSDIVVINDLIKVSEDEIKEYNEYLNELLEYKKFIENLILLNVNEFNKLKDKYDFILKQIADLKKTISSNEIYISRLEAQKLDKKEKINQFKQSLTKEQLISKLSDQKKKYNDLRKQLNDLIIRRDTIKPFLDKTIKNEGNNCPECGQEVSSLYVFEVKSKFENELKDVLNKIKILENSLKEIEKEIEKINSYVTSIDLIDGYQKQLNDIESNISKEVKRCKDFERQISKYQDEYKVIAFELSKFRNPNIVNEKFKWFIDNIDYISNRLNMCIIELRKEINRYQDIIKRNEVEILSWEKQLNDRKEIELKINDNKNKLKCLNDDLKIYKELIVIFGKTGVQAIIIENVLSILEQFTNSILSRMQTNFIVKFKTVKQIQSGNERETLDIIVYDNGIERSIETYSGGERTLINLSIRLALSKILSSLYNVDVRTIFLDEVLAALDEVNRDEAVKIIRFLSTSFSQILVISHEDRVKDIIPQNILVKRYLEESKVIIS